MDVFVGRHERRYDAHSQSRRRLAFVLKGVSVTEYDVTLIADLLR